MYKEWCDENGHKPRTEQGFGKDLRSVVPTLRVTQPRTDEGRERHYVGISLRGAYIDQPRVPRVPGVPAVPETSDSEAVARVGTRESPMLPPLNVPLSPEPPGDPRSQAPTLRNVRCPYCRWRFKTAVQPGEQAWCKECNNEFSAP